MENQSHYFPNFFYLVCSLLETLMFLIYIGDVFLPLSMKALGQSKGEIP